MKIRPLITKLWCKILLKNKLIKVIFTKLPRSSLNIVRKPRKTQHLIVLRRAGLSTLLCIKVKLTVPWDKTIKSNCVVSFSTPSATHIGSSWLSVFTPVYKSSHQRNLVLLFVENLAPANPSGPSVLQAGLKFHVILRWFDFFLDHFLSTPLSSSTTKKWPSFYAVPQGSEVI